MGKRIGTGKPGPGRKKGVPNKMTTSAKEAFQFAFDNIGGAVNLAEWAKKNPTEFYRLYSRLIPIDIDAKVKSKFTITFREGNG